MSDIDDHTPNSTSTAGSEPDSARESADRFDLAGREIAALLRSSHETTERLQAEAEAQAAAILERAEADADTATAVRLAAAEQRAEEIQVEAARHLEEAEKTKAATLAWADQFSNSRAETADRLDEVLASLDRAVEEIARLEAQAVITQVEVTAARSAIVASHEAYQLAASGPMPAPPAPPAPTPTPTPTPAPPAPPSASGPTEEPDPRHEAPATPGETPDPAPRPANGRATTAPRPPATAAAPGVTEAVRSAVQRAVAERRANQEHTGE